MKMSSESYPRKKLAIYEFNGEPQNFISTAIPPLTIPLL